MAENSNIEWTDHTFNPWMGCAKVHAGCTNCYAETLMDRRYKKVTWGPAGTRVVASNVTWRNPLGWQKYCEKHGCRRRVFCASLADVFEHWQGPLLNAKGERLKYNATHGIGPWEGMGDYAVDATMNHVREKLFALIDATPLLDWILVTKRPENIQQMWPPHPDGGINEDEALFRHNVWLLTSVSDQATAERQIPELLRCRDLAPVLGISAEPLLGPIDLTYLASPEPPSDYLTPIAPHTAFDVVNGATFAELGSGEVEYSAPKCRLDWVIVGGESGAGARPFIVEHADGIIHQCRAAGVPVFMKQMGGQPVTTNANMYDWPGEPRTFAWGDAAASCGYILNDRKGGDPDEWPPEFRVRQFPNQQPAEATR